MFSLMGNCISSIRSRRQPRKPVILALLGVDNAGKTTASSSFSGEPIDEDVAPTIGFRNVKFSFDKYDITLYDIGGGKNIRPVWKNYFPEVYGFIYMVDSSTADRMDEARETFRESLGHPHVSGKPVLLLANKQDKPDALDEVDICDMLQLETVVNANKCPCRIDACSALRGTGKKMDRNMKEGLRWLLAMVEKSWDELKARVESDMKAVDEVRKVEAAARRERVRKQREEREKQEEEERQRLGIEKKDSDEEEIVDGDPFKPLDINELKKKEETMKAEKKRRKDLEAAVKNLDSHQEALFSKVPQSSRSHKSARSQDIGEGDKIFTIGGEGERLFTPRPLPSSLPPLEQLGTPFLEDGGQSKKKKKKKSPRNSDIPAEQTRQSKDRATDDDEDIVLATPRSQPTLTGSYIENSKSTATISNIKVSTHDDFPSRELLAAGISRVPRPLDGGDAEEEADTPRTRKVKKKKLRHLGTKQNGQAVGDLELTPRPRSYLKPLDGGDSDGSGAGSQRRKKSWKNGFGPTEEETAELSARSVTGKDGASPLDKRLNKVSRHSQMHSNVSIESDPQGSRTWGMAEDLPAVADDAVSFRQPNVIDDDDMIL